MNINAFEWDDNKRYKNIIKHRIDFSDILDMFIDPKFQWRFDPNSFENDDEDVLQGIGFSSRGGVIFVAYAERVYKDNGKIVCRLISARRAKKKEINEYRTHTFENAV